MADLAANEVAEQTRAKLRALWERNVPIIRIRLDLIKRAASADPLPQELRTEAMQTAHKLAGSLGMFGFAEGTRLARELELLFEKPAPETATLSVLVEQLQESLFPSSTTPK